MHVTGWTALLVVRCSLVLAAPRAPDERVVEVVEREMRHQRAGVNGGHKLFRSRHRTTHTAADLLPPPEAEVRCYCNLPACVTTGYMCQSMVGSCFSESTERAGRSHSQHGCLELLSRHKQHICARLHSENKADLRLRCCTEDMCNNAVDVQVAHLRNSTQRPLPTPPPELLSLGGGGGRQSSSRSGELWLRAATIAVPIAGMFILSILVLLAVRMLRRESKPPQYQYAKAPLCLEPPAGGGSMCDSPLRLVPGAFGVGVSATSPTSPLRLGSGSAAAAAAALVDVHRTVCCVYAADPRCPHVPATPSPAV